MTEHLDLDGLADVLAGLPAPDHLAGCADCQARLAALTAALPAVDGALGALPAPEEPADLGDRLTAALADVGDDTLPSATATADVIPLTKERNRWLPILSAAAAAAALITGGVLLSQRGTDSTTTATPHYVMSSSGTNYLADGQALRSALPGLLAGGLQDKGTEVGAAGPRVPAATSPQSMSGLAPADLSTLRTTNGLAACLASLTDPSNPGLPLALDYAEFAGQPALVVVLPSAKVGKVDVFVVGSGCSQSDAHVLLFTRLPKP